MQDYAIVFLEVMTFITTLLSAYAMWKDEYAKAAYWISLSCWLILILEL